MIFKGTPLSAGPIKKILTVLTAVALAGTVGAPSEASGTKAAVEKITVAAAADIYVSQASPTLNHADYTWLSVCPKACDGVANSERRALLRFDVAGVPSGATDVTMALELQPARSTGTTVAVHPVTAAWEVASTSWTRQPAFGSAIAERTGFTSGEVARLDVSSAFEGNGDYSFGLTASAGAQAVLHSSRAPGGLGPRLVISYTEAPVVAEGPLPFDLPSVQALRASPKKVFAHYFTPYPVSFDNKAESEDYYTRNYLNPAGESGKHIAYGGLLRDRPLPRAPLSGNWQLADMEREVRTARAAGIDGFTLDILSLTSQNWTRAKLLIEAAENVDPGFGIVLMPDMTSLKADAATLATSMAELAESDSAYRLGNGSLVISPFKAENQTAAWWSGFINEMQQAHGIKVALVPVFLNFAANYKAFAPISHGFSNWGNRSPNQQSGAAGNIKTSHDLGKIWMQPVAIQDERPNQGIYDEANNTENLRVTWDNAISGGTDWVQLTTWNDFSEGTQFVPSAHNGGAYLDLSSYYLTKLKTGTSPPIVRDTVYLTHRVQMAAARPTSGTQTKFMTPRANTSTPRDTVEILSFLTGAATVKASIGGTAQSYQAPAGVSAQRYPLKYGTNGVSVTRGGVTTAEVASPFEVRQDFSVQDLQYNAVSSGRR
ncbi:hypothetical protein DKM19_37880 [Streptosporangium sp. 'caverna']|nr:hypothetical protein DKM19_37880 [Streptosporangium sp. 'caverna']